MKYLVYQAYGHADILHEAIFSILSFRRVASEALRQSCQVWVYTDQPEYLDRFLQGSARYLPMPPERLQAWRGPINFVHRVKVEMLRDFCADRQGAVLYADTDTVFEADPSPIFAAIEQGTCWMHVREGHIADRPNPVLRKLHRFLASDQNPTVQLPTRQVRIPPTADMWNAGLLGFHTDRRQLADEVLLLTDTIYPHYPRHVVEQLAFSWLFQQEKELRPAADWVCHYWYFKEFRPVLEAFFGAMAGRSVDELAALTARLSPEALSLPKREYENLSFFPKTLRKWRGKRWEMPEYRFW